MPVVEFVRGKRFIVVDLEVRSKVVPVHAMKACGVGGGGTLFLHAFLP
jgi:hypothetical protein